MDSNSLGILMGMKHSTIHNYGIPGLSSSLIGTPSKNGCTRLFECSREHQEVITPHSHRFDFVCVVLRGSVVNRLWTETDGHDPDSDQFMKSLLSYKGEPGNYTKQKIKPSWFCYDDQEFTEGDTYSMSASQIHSIFFSRGSIVLFVEGPQLCTTNYILEPVVNGDTIETFKVEPWMFKR